MTAMWYLRCGQNHCARRDIKAAARADVYRVAAMMIKCRKTMSLNGVLGGARVSR